jgi:hypothetical protein
MTPATLSPVQQLQAAIDLLTTLPESRPNGRRKGRVTDVLALTYKLYNRYGFDDFRLGRVEPYRLYGNRYGDRFEQLTERHPDDIGLETKLRQVMSQPAVMAAIVEGATLEALPHDGCFYLPKTRLYTGRFRIKAQIEVLKKSLADLETLLLSPSQIQQLQAAIDLLAMLPEPRPHTGEEMGETTEYFALNYSFNTLESDFNFELNKVHYFSTPAYQLTNDFGLGSVWGEIEMASRLEKALSQPAVRIALVHGSTDYHIPRSEPPYYVSKDCISDSPFSIKNQIEALRKYIAKLETPTTLPPVQQLQAAINALVALPESRQYTGPFKFIKTVYFGLFYKFSNQNGFHYFHLGLVEPHFGTRSRHIEHPNDIRLETELWDVMSQPAVIAALMDGSTNHVYSGSALWQSAPKPELYLSKPCMFTGCDGIKTQIEELRKHMAKLEAQ